MQHIPALTLQSMIRSKISTYPNLVWRVAKYRRTLQMTRCLNKSRPSPRVASLQRLEYKTPAPRAIIPPVASTSSITGKVNRVRYHPVPMFIGATAVISISGYIFYIIADLYRPQTKPVPKRASAQADVSSRYDIIASTFDSTVDSSEYWLGLKSLRQKMVSKAQGDVLEVSVGTGRNLEFYEWDIQGNPGMRRLGAMGNIRSGNVKSLTAIDTSIEMLSVAHDKLETLFPDGNIKVRWVLGDAAAKGVIPASPSSSSQVGDSNNPKYDTIVQTMGLCSSNDPVALLKNLGDHLKEGGRILLLEHGRGRWEWLNTLLDRSAESHALAFGCWWNRDLKEIVEASGLEVVKMDTPKWWHGGTTWWIELTKSQSLSREGKEIEA